MSLQAKVVSLLSGIADPATRIDIASTIHYLFELYVTGGAREEDIRRSLVEICIDVLTYSRPELTFPERKEKAEQLADEFIRAFRIESLHRRMVSRFRPPL